MKQFLKQKGIPLVLLCLGLLAILPLMVPGRIHAGAYLKDIRSFYLKKENGVKKTSGRRTYRIQLKAGQTVNLSPVIKVSPDRDKYKELAFSSSNKKVVTVSKKGKVKAKKRGTARVVLYSKKPRKKSRKILILKVTVSGKQKTKTSSSSPSPSVTPSASPSATPSAVPSAASTATAPAAS